MAYWDFRAGDGDIVYDRSDNLNHGTINGATWSGDIPTPPVFGCTDIYADNFNSEATNFDFEEPLKPSAKLWDTKLLLFLPDPISTSN